MVNSLSLAPQNSFLATYRLPVLDFADTPRPNAEPLLTPRQLQDSDPRNLSMRVILSQNAKHSDEDAAGLKVKLAASMLQEGKSANAESLAKKSIELHPNQWAGHRILIELLMAQQQYEEAYKLLDSLKIKRNVPAWDVPLPRKEIQLCAAACAWRIKDWERVEKHLKKAFSKGVKTMPRKLQEDWFRLALYRHQPDDAAEAASLLVSNNTLEFTDALLQTLVQQGWTEQALPLYRAVYAQDPRNQLLRRRLVALCIKEGEIDEARRLTEPGALDLNP